MHMPHKKPEQTALRRRALAVEIVNRKRFQRDFIAQLITFARINFEYFTSSIWISSIDPQIAPIGERNYIFSIFLRYLR